MKCDNPKYSKDGFMMNKTHKTVEECNIFCNSKDVIQVKRKFQTPIKEGLLNAILMDGSSLGNLKEAQQNGESLD